MKVTLNILAIVFFALPQLWGQEIKGRFYGDLFANANYNFSEKQTSFRLNRLHFAYKREFADKFYFNGMIESAREAYNPDTDYNNITNLFEFCIGYNSELFDAKFGLIGTKLNQQQEQLWKHRYIDKVFADKYGFAPTNDFGALIVMKPTDVLSFDVCITNGEGHKNYQADDAFRYAAGITYQSGSGFIARVYGDVNVGDEFVKSNLIGILGFHSEKLSVGFEWNHQFAKDDQERFGLSGYANVALSKKLNLLGRFDNISSNPTGGFDDGWNVGNDGRLVIGGLEYILSKHICIALDYRGWMRRVDESTESYIFLDVAVVF